MSVSPARPHLELVAAPPATAAPDAAPDAARDLAAQPAARAVRVVALARLADAARGHAQLLAGQADGLHDLRVALRRLRTLMRAFRPLMEDTLRRKTVRALRSLVRATGEARDAEVAATWIMAQAEVPPRARSGVRDVTQRFEDERDAALKSVRARLEQELPGLLNRLNKQMATYLDTQAVGEPMPAVSFGDAAAAVIERQKARLARALTRVKSISDVDEAHRARIAAKRLRYLLEPLHEGSSQYTPLERLVQLQDALGAARDAHQLTRRFVREIGEMAARDARVKTLVAIGVKHTPGPGTPFRRIKPGLVELARRARAEERRAFAEFRRDWGKGSGEEILASIG